MSTHSPQTDKIIVYCNRDDFYPNMIIDENQWRQEGIANGPGKIKLIVQANVTENKKCFIQLGYAFAPQFADDESSSLIDIHEKSKDYMEKFQSELTEDTDYRDIHTNIVDIRFAARNGYITSKFNTITVTLDKPYKVSYIAEAIKYGLKQGILYPHIEKKINGKKLVIYAEDSFSWSKDEWKVEKANPELTLDDYMCILEGIDYCDRSFNLGYGDIGIKSFFFDCGNDGICEGDISIDIMIDSYFTFDQTSEEESVAYNYKFNDIRGIVYVHEVR